MANPLLTLPDELKQLVILCRQGRLFEVEAWIAAGRTFRLPEGRFYTWPLRVAVDLGFHSLVEVLLRAGVSDRERRHALRCAVDKRRLDLVELLVKYGADPLELGMGEVISARSPEITRWFISKGADMRSGWPIAMALKEGHREFLGVYMDLRDTVPSARQQAAMALRHHCREGNMKWISLLLWAGADPRMRVPDLDYLDDEVFLGTAWEDALWRGQVDVIKKIGLDPARDDPSECLNSLSRADKHLVRLFLDAGADPNKRFGESTPMSGLMESLERRLEKGWLSFFDEELECLELAAERGGRWRPQSTEQYSGLRRALLKATGYQAVSCLRRLLRCQAIEPEVFRELMSVPRMKDLLRAPTAGVVVLRELVGFDLRADRRRRRRPASTARALAMVPVAENAPKTV